MSTTTAEAPVSNVATRPHFKDKYEHYIGGKWVAPSSGEYFDNSSPLDGKVFTKAARGNAKDVELAIDAAHTAFATWGKSAATYRSNLLIKIAQVIEDNLEYLAIVETIDNGKAIRETRLADLPLAIDHFRYFAGVIRADEGSMSEHDEDTVCLNVHEPIGVVGQIIPWNFPLLMATWKVAPALAAGCCVVVKPAEQTPTSIMCLMELEIGVLRMERRDALQGERLRRWLEIVLAAFEGRILGIDTAVARVCAKLHVPDPRPERDALIAATALVHGLTVVTRNTADFGPMGVRLFNPWLPQSA